MKYRLISCIDGRMTPEEFTDDNVISAMSIRGYELKDVNLNSRHREELQGQPIFHGLCGPMWDGDAIRYETTEAYRHLSA